MPGQLYSKKPYRDNHEIEEIVRRFESCALSPDEFDHQAHLIVGLWYLSELEMVEATDRMRAGLHKFLNHHGIGLEIYNETITVFWLKLISSFQSNAHADRSVVDIANELVEIFGGKPKLALDYYSQERLMSEEAKTGWVEPDLKPLDF